MTDPAAPLAAVYPLRDRRIWGGTTYPWALALGIPTLLLYLVSLSPAVGWWDSGELLACASTLSVAHRPGFPLYVIVGRLTFGWLDDPRWLANAFSAFTAATALVILWRSLCLFAGDRPATRVWVAIGGLLVAACPLYFRQAIRIEVYAPVYACLACALLLAAAAQRAPDPPTAMRRFLLSIYLVSLAFCLHSAVAAPVGVVVAGLFAWGRFRPSFRQWALACVCFALGLSIYLYVPLRAPLSPYVWGQPESLSGFFAYFTASDAHGIIAREASGTLTRVFELCSVIAHQTSPLLLWAGVCGVVWSVARGNGLGSAPLVLGGFGLLVAASVVSYVIDDNADMHAYLVPVLWALWWGWARLDPGSWSVRENGSRVVRAACVIIPFVALGSAFVHTGESYREMRPLRLGLSDQWGTEILKSARPGDLLILQDANTDFLLRGLSQAGMGTGVTVLNASLAESEWYRLWWESRHGVTSDSQPAPEWVRGIAQEWSARGRVLVDFGIPGFPPEELAPLGMVGLWDSTAASGSISDVPVWHPAGAEDDPECVRSAVWFYYRLALFHRERGFASLAMQALELGLTWAPGEETLTRERAQLALDTELWGAQPEGHLSGTP